MHVINFLRKSRVVLRTRVIENTGCDSRLRNFFRDSRAMEVVSGLTHIEVTNDDPIVLFKNWLEEARSFSTPMPRAFCLATASGCGKVSARHLLLGRLDDDGFVTTTNGRSPKSQDLSEVPSAAMCFHWAYRRENGETVSRQVRIEGTVTKLGREEYEDIYEKSDISYKIRDHICEQSSPVDWNELKASHDRMLEKIKSEGVAPPMPEHTAGYKLFPSSMEFYYAKGRLIADRVLFLKNPKASDWTHHHLAA
ncbi:pyridoxine/pyridoxamine 5'-phosphate oxidase [Athalia rosae]|uniref:pyridoxine/pyridoxamine 5'-phosphate oxidase n=1 Tax=Athalia rosae TaxID=37344 RepID=UPI0020347C64|nr:pyridoxine/pyridoxamine 5'-phosphate oxidase [Athalia rosae]